MRDRWLTPDHVACHLEGIVHGRRGSESEAANRARLAAHDDDLTEVLERVGAPVPHVERVDAVVRVARAVEVPVPLVLSEPLLVALLDLERVRCVCLLYTSPSPRDS